ncbi:hypothetical protein ACIXIZ_001548 [Staphylococcus aureus]
MNYLKMIEDELNGADLERKLRILRNLICERLTTDELAEQTFKQTGNPFLANHAREFQDFNYIVLSTLKSVSKDVKNAVEEINDCIEKASSENFGEESDDAKKLKITE